MEPKKEAGTLVLLGVSQVSLVTMEISCLRPQRLPQGRRPLTHNLTSLWHNQRQGRPRRARSERRRERERELAGRPDWGKEVEAGKGGGFGQGAELGHLILRQWLTQRDKVGLCSVGEAPASPRALPLRSPRRDTGQGQLIAELLV